MGFWYTVVQKIVDHNAVCDHNLRILLVDNGFVLVERTCQRWSVALALRPSNACINRCIVTDADDSNYHVANVNKILHVNDFTYL